MKRTDGAPAKTPNCESRVISVASSSSSPKRRSGLSDPKRASASAHVSRGNGASSSTPRQSRQAVWIICSIKREEELLIREGHLDVELRDLLHPVGAQVLVPEAARDLEVAVEAADHEELLEDLGRLREGKEPAGLKAARDDEVARPLGRRLEEDRRLDLEEAAALHRPPDRRDHRAAESDVALHLRAAQVEPAVAEAKSLVDVLFVELEGQRRRGGDDLQGVDLELDLAGRDVRVDRLGRAADDLSLRAQDELVADRMADLRGFGRALGVEHELADAGPVAEVDEDEPAVVAPGIRPAGEGQPLADVVGPHLAAHEVAPGHAVTSERSVSASTTTTRSAPRRLACVRWPLTERPAKSASARMPAARSSATLARTAVRSAPSSQMKKTSTPSSAGGSTPASSRARRSRSIPAPKPDAGRVRPAELLRQAVVAAAAAQGALRAALGPDELPGGARVVVEAADERRHHLVAHPVGIEIAPHLGEVLAARIAERVPDRRRLAQDLLHCRWLPGDVVERAEGVARRLLAGGLVELAGVLLEPGPQPVEIGGPAVPRRRWSSARAGTR